MEGELRLPADAALVPGDAKAVVLGPGEELKWEWDVSTQEGVEWGPAGKNTRMVIGLADRSSEVVFITPRAPMPGK